MNDNLPVLKSAIRRCAPTGTQNCDLWTEIIWSESKITFEHQRVFENIRFAPTKTAIQNLIMVRAENGAYLFARVSDFIHSNNTEKTFSRRKCFCSEFRDDNSIQ